MASRNGRCRPPQTPAEKEYLGGWWGAVGCPCTCGLYATRLPDDWNDADYGEDAVARMKDQGVPIPDIEHSGVTYRAVSVAASMYADGTGMNPSKQSYVWLQTNWNPVGDLCNTQPRAGFTVLRVFDSTKAGAADPSNTACEVVENFLANTTGGSPFYWDNANKLANYFSQDRKVFCGPEYFGFFRRRISGNDRIEYWTAPGAATANQAELQWANQEASTNQTTWLPVYVSAHQFPFALFHKVTEYETDGTGITWLQRRYRIGKMNLSTAALTPELETNMSLGGSPITNYGPDTDFYNNGAEYVTAANSAIYVVDWDTCLMREDSKELPGTPPTIIWPANYFPDGFESGTPQEGSEYTYAGMGSYISRAENGGGVGTGGSTSTYPNTCSQRDAFGVPLSWINFPHCSVQIQPTDSLPGLNPAVTTPPSLDGEGVARVFHAFHGNGRFYGNTGMQFLYIVGGDNFLYDRSGGVFMEDAVKLGFTLPTIANVDQLYVACAGLAWQAPAPGDDPLKETQTLCVGAERSFTPAAASDYWTAKHIDSLTSDYSSPEGAVYRLQNPPTGKWFSGGVEQETGRLCYDGSLDEYHDRSP